MITRTMENGTEDYGWLSEVLTDRAFGWLDKTYHPSNIDISVPVATEPADPERIRNRYGGIDGWIRRMKTVVAVLDEHEEHPHRDTAERILAEMETGTGEADGWHPRLSVCRQVLDELDEHRARDYLDEVLDDLRPYTVPPGGAVGRIRADIAWDWADLPDEFVEPDGGVKWIKDTHLIANTVQQGMNLDLDTRFQAVRTSRIAFAYIGDPNNENDGITVEIHTDLQFDAGALTAERARYTPPPTSIPNPNYTPPQKSGYADPVGATLKAGEDVTSADYETARRSHTPPGGAFVEEPQCDGGAECQCDTYGNWTGTFEEWCAHEETKEQNTQLL